MKMAEVEKAIEITDARIQFVSLVDKAANLRTFLLRKANDGKAQFQTYGKIVKKDAVSHYVTGIVYEPMTEDSDSNFMTEAEITKAAYYFARNSNKIDLQHNYEPLPGAHVVESWIAKADFKVGDEQVRKGTWLMTVEVTDRNVWDAIEKGELTGFSMGGVGNYGEEDVSLETNDTKKSDKKGLLKQLAEALGISEKEDPPVKKAGKKMSNKNKATLMDIYEKLGEFLKGFDEQEPEGEEPSKADIQESAESTKNKEDNEVTKEDVEAIVAKSIKAALEKKGTDETAQKAEKLVTEESINEMVKAAIAKASAAAPKTEEKSTAETATPKTEERMTAEQVQQMITDAVAKAMDPLLKSKGLPSNLGNIQKSEEEQHYLHGIL